MVVPQRRRTGGKMHHSSGPCQGRAQGSQIGDIRPDERHIPRRLTRGLIYRGNLVPCAV